MIDAGPHLPEVTLPLPETRVVPRLRGACLPHLLAGVEVAIRPPPHHHILAVGGMALPRLITEAETIPLGKVFFCS